MSDPLWSFVIPAYNEEATLANCLRSLRALEPAGPFEVLVVDNNSTDDTAEIGARLADRVISCSQQGISAARNCGAEAATGEVVCFMDADAMPSPRWLTAARAAAAKQSIPCVTGWNWFLDPNPLRGSFYNCYHLVVYPVISLARLFGRPVIFGNNFAMDRHCFLELGGFPFFVGEDIKFSKTLRKKHIASKFTRGMKIGYSSRRFRKVGFFTVMKVWLQCLARDIPENNYGIHYAVRGREKKVPQEKENL